MSDLFHLDPLTAREALLAIRMEVAGKARPELIDGLAKAGLNRTDPPNFELTDHLADRLAQAHAVLREVRAAGSEDLGPLRLGELAERAAETLALPPDLEAMVERRIGHE